MKVKSISLLLATSILMAYPFTSYSQTNNQIALSRIKNIKMESLVDVKPKHWAYNAVKYVVEDLDFFEPKTPTRFMGDKKATRYELARAFYFASQGLEKISEKDIRIVPEENNNIIISDVDENNRELVNKLVNQYGLMQLMPDNKFMGNREMTRYELAFDINNYLMLLEKKIGSPNQLPRDRASELTDLSPNHWAYTAITNIVDKYKIMDGYPQNVFGGDQKLTRYEVAALLKRFVEYVDTKILSLPQPTPTPEPTPIPTPTPEPTPEPTPTPIPKHLSKFDIKAGGAMRSLMSPNGTDNSFMRFDPAANLEFNYWFSRFGITLGGDMTFNDFQFPIKNSSRLTAGALVNYKILDQRSDEDMALNVGLGYNFMNWSGAATTIGTRTNLTSIQSHGPKLNLNFELPFAHWIALNVNDSFTYMLLGDSGIRNDLFIGFNLPAYSLFSAQIGYTQTLYSISGVSNLTMQNGLQGNLRFRF